MLAQSGERQRSGKRRLREGKRGRQRTGIAREGFLDRRSKRCFWLLLSPQTKVARAGARNYPRRRQRSARAGARNSPCAGCGRDEGVLRRCAATPHPPPSGAPVSLRVGRFADLTRHRRVIQHREPLKGKANGGASFNTADPSRGRLTEACHSTPRTPRGKAGGCGRGTKKGPAPPVLLCFLGCAAHCALLCSFWSMAVNSGGRGQWSSTGSPVRGWTKRRPAAWRHWPVRPGTGFLAP